MEIEASCELNVAEIKEKILAEARRMLRDLSQEGKLEGIERKDFLKEAGDYILKIVGLQEFLVNESLPLYPFLLSFLFLSFFLVSLIFLHSPRYAACGLYSSVQFGVCHSSVRAGGEGKHSGSPGRGTQDAHQGRTRIEYSNFFSCRISSTIQFPQIRK